jgi:polysaccharide biosynthesis protein PslH
MATADQELLYLTPIAPAPSGNGLAMRGYLFLKAASQDFTVRIVIVPVAGLNQAAAQPAGPPAAVLSLPDARQVVTAVPALLARPAWRDRLGRASPLPRAARHAPATMASAAVTAAGTPPGTPVHAARSYLMPLAVAVAEQLRSPWATADLDDDDQNLAHVAGQHEEALGYERLVRVFGPLFRRLAVAGPDDAAAISARHGLRPAVIPNAVPGGARPAARRVSGGGSLLFAGNLTYWPNVDAANRLVRDVLPRVRATAAGPVTVILAGDAGLDGGVWELAREPGVRVTGFVPDLAPCYAAADVVVAPLAYGAGTRIKLLEAFAAGVPVVTTAVGAAGLEAADGVHALLADTPAGQAAAVGRLLTDAMLRERLVRSAASLVATRYTHAVVIPQIRRFFAEAAGLAPPLRTSGGGLMSLLEQSIRTPPDPASQGSSGGARG